MDRREPVLAEWKSTREQEVAVVAGFRIRGRQVEYINPQGYITHARPADSAVARLWQLLMTSEKEWDGP